MPSPLSKGSPLHTYSVLRRSTHAVPLPRSSVCRDAASHRTPDAADTASAGMRTMPLLLALALVQMRYCRVTASPGADSASGCVVCSRTSTLPITTSSGRWLTAVKLFAVNTKRCGSGPLQSGRG